MWGQVEGGGSGHVWSGCVGECGGVKGLCVQCM